MTAFLLDTHAFIWFGAGDLRMPAGIRPLVAERTNPVFVSAATAWEITTKFRIGKLPEAAPIVADFAGALEIHGFIPLPISIDHAQLAGSLPGSHRDPFDRMLAAQALSENLTLVSNEIVLDQFGVRRLW